MASRRMIDPAFWQSESLMELDYRQRLLFIGLISNADDQGRLKGNPKLVKALVFPFDDISADEVQADLDELATVECISVYKVGSKTCIQILNWWQYQHPQWAYPSDLPPMQGWRDRLRYRSDNKVVTDNWKGEDEPDEPTPPYGSNLNGDDEVYYAQLGKALPKEPAKAMGGPVVVSSSNRTRLELDKERESRTQDNERQRECRNAMLSVCYAVDSAKQATPDQQKWVVEAFADIDRLFKPTPDEFQAFQAWWWGDRPPTPKQVLNDWSKFRANPEPKRKDIRNGQTSTNGSQRSTASTPRKIDPYKNNGKTITPAGLPIDPDILAKFKQQSGGLSQ